MSEPTPDRNPLLKQLDNLDEMLEGQITPPPSAAPLSPWDEEGEEPTPEPSPYEPDELLGELESLATVLSPTAPLPRRHHERPHDESLDLFPTTDAADGS